MKMYTKKIYISARQKINPEHSSPRSLLSVSSFFSAPCWKRKMFPQLGWNIVCGFTILTLTQGPHLITEETVNQ